MTTATIHTNDMPVGASRSVASAAGQSVSKCVGLDAINIGTPLSRVAAEDLRLGLKDFSVVNGEIWE